MRGMDAHSQGRGEPAAQPRRHRALVTRWLLLAPVAMAAMAAVPDADTIMANADRVNRPRYEIAHMRMELSGGDGRPSERELVWRTVNEGGVRSSLLKFIEPASLRGVGMLIIETEGKPNAIWHYAPATRNVRRIAGEHRQNRFMGTEFVFEDFEGLKLGKYAFNLLRSEGCGGTSICYVVDARASDADEKSSSGYGRKVFWIDQKSYAIVKIELFDLAGTLAKIYESADLRPLAGYWRPKRQTMTDVRSARSTVLVELDRTLDEAFDQYYVSQQYLRAE
jgi:hypothetical protein